MRPFASSGQTRRPCLAGVVPPHLLEALARAGSASEREWARATLHADEQIRRLRSLAAAAPAVTVAVASAAGRAASRRSVHDAAHRESLPGRLVRAEGRPATGDSAADESYDSLGAVRDFWSRVFGRASVDGEGASLRASVHFGSAYGNAFWNGAQMVFGDGDGRIFAGFTRSLDVVGHELAHGVTQHECGLAYFGEPGAINESLSDVFGSLARQFTLGQDAREADWLVGAGVFGPSVAGRALRSMKAPGTAYDDPRLGRDPQPSHARDYVHTAADNGGVHVNSGIPNHAFYLAAVAIGGAAWERAGRIWYGAMRDPRLAPDSGFARFASVTWETARALYGAGSPEASSTFEAWRSVGVRPAPLAAPAGGEPGRAGAPSIA